MLGGLCLEVLFVFEVLHGFFWQRNNKNSETPCSDHSPVFKLGVVLPWPIQIPVFSGHSVPGSIWGALPFLMNTEELSPEPGTPPGAAALPRR